MTSEQKKALLLLSSVIFNYHGFDEEEKKILVQTANKIDAQEELKWVQSFIEEDIYTLFERAREYFKSTILIYDKETRIQFLKTVWEDANKKGHITEMEAMAILKLAKDWGAQKDLLTLIRK